MINLVVLASICTLTIIGAIFAAAYYIGKKMDENLHSEIKELKNILESLIHKLRIK